MSNLLFVVYEPDVQEMALGIGVEVGVGGYLGDIGTGVCAEVAIRAHLWPGVIVFYSSNPPRKTN